MFETHRGGSGDLENGRGKSKCPWEPGGKEISKEDGEALELDRVRVKDQHLTELPSKSLIHQILQPGTGKRAQLLLRTLNLGLPRHS